MAIFCPFQSFSFFNNFSKSPWPSFFSLSLNPPFSTSVLCHVVVGIMGSDCQLCQACLLSGLQGIYVRNFQRKVWSSCLMPLGCEGVMNTGIWLTNRCHPELFLFMVVFFCIISHLNLIPNNIGYKCRGDVILSQSVILFSFLLILVKALELQ